MNLMHTMCMGHEICTRLDLGMQDRVNKIGALLGEECWAMSKFKNMGLGSNEIKDKVVPLGLGKIHGLA